MYGMKWHDHMRVVQDDEHKITEFNYEQYFSPELLKDIDTQSEQFKTYIKIMNLSSRTEFERHADAKEQFTKMMPFLATLEEFEMKSLIHMIQNRTAEEKLISELTSQELAEKLAKMSEDENHALKNRYRH
jgi:DNA-binding helix-hairpin-helix protein with protein kinase domain